MVLCTGGGGTERKQSAGPPCQPSSLTPPTRGARFGLQLLLAKGSPSHRVWCSAPGQAGCFGRKGAGSARNQTSIKHVGTEQSQPAQHQRSATHPSSVARGKESIQLLTRCHGGHLSHAGTAERNRRVSAINQNRNSCSVKVGELGAASDHPRTQSIALRIPTSPWL